MTRGRRLKLATYQGAVHLTAIRSFTLQYIILYYIILINKCFVIVL